MQITICTQKAWPRSRSLGVAILLGLGLCFVPSGFLTNAFAQDQAAPLATNPAAAPEPTTPDALTNSRIQQFISGGLIDRQSQLSEGLLLMDRQLRQMQLVEQILAAYGPDAQVEIAPGEFRNFRDTPAGMRQEIAHIDLLLQLAEKRAELVAVQGVVSQASTVDATGLGSLIVEEIYGQLGALQAVVQIDGARITVRSNDNLPTGHRVISVGRDRLAVELMDGGLREFEIR